jgi:hypothetical protein
MEHFADADIFDGEFPIEDHGMDEWLGDYSLLPPDIFDPELPIEVPGPEDWLVHYPAPDIFGPDIDVDVPEIEDWLVNFPSLDIFDLYFAADVLGIGDPIAQYPSAQPGINDLDIAVDVPGVEDWLRDDDFFSNHFNPDQVPIIEPTPPFGEPDRRDSEDWLSDDIPSCTLSDSDSSLFADLRLPIQTYEYAIEIDDADFLPSEDDIEEEILSRRNASEMGIRRLHPFLPQQSESTKTSQNRDIDQRSAPALSRKSPLNEKAHRPRLRQGLPDVSEPWILHQRRNGRLAPPSEREHQSKPREDESANRRNEGLPRLGTAVTAAAAIGLFTEAEKRRKRRKTERSDSAPEKTPNSEDNHSTLLENDDSVLQPETQPISQEQLVREVRGIINELVALESNCIEVHNKQAASARAGTGAQPKLNNEQWQALVASHQTLLHEHHYFVLASQNPTASPALCRLASRYAMPTRAHGKLSRDKLATEVEGQDPPGDYAVQEKEPLHQATLELAIDSPKAPESSPIRTESTLSTVTECPSSAPFGPSAMLNRLISSALDVTSDDVGLDSIEELPEKTPTPSSTDNRTPNESSVLAEEPSPPAPSSPSPPRTGAGTYTCSRCPQSFSRVCDLKSVLPPFSLSQIKHIRKLMTLQFSANTGSTMKNHSLVQFALALSAEGKISHATKRGLTEIPMAARDTIAQILNVENGISSSQGEIT